MVDAVRRGFKKNLVASVYNISRKNVTKWYKRAHHRERESYKDKKPESPATLPKRGKSPINRLSSLESEPFHFIRPHVLLRKRPDHRLVNRWTSIPWSSSFSYTKMPEADDSIATLLPSGRSLETAPNPHSSFEIGLSLPQPPTS
jgi:hypothetical protein